MQSGTKHGTKYIIMILPKKEIDYNDEGGDTCECESE